MCGRTYYNIDLNLLKKKFRCKKIIENEKLKKGIVNKNNYSPIIFQTHANDDEESEKDNILCVCSWGINPMPFRKMDDKIVLINARFETLTTKKTFSALIGKNRCAIVVNGFFEWKNVDSDNAKNSKSKLPYFIFCKTGFSLMDEDVEKEKEEKEKVKVKENVKGEKLEENVKEDVKENVKENVKEDVKEKDDAQGDIDISDNGSLTKKEENDLTKNNASKVKGKRKLEKMDVSNIKGEIKKTKTEKEEEENKKEKEKENENEKKKGREEVEGHEKNGEDTNGTDTNKPKKEVSEENAEQFKTCMLLAGLYTVDENNVYKYTIITIGSETEFLQDIHERCPLFLSEKSLPLWLNSDKSYNDIKKEVENEHMVVCNDLSKVAVTSWSTYVVSSADKSKNSRLRYFKS